MQAAGLVVMFLVNGNGITAAINGLFQRHHRMGRFGDRLGEDIAADLIADS